MAEYTVRIEPAPTAPARVAAPKRAFGVDTPVNGNSGGRRTPNKKEQHKKRNDKDRVRRSRNSITERELLRLTAEAMSVYNKLALSETALMNPERCAELQDESLKKKFSQKQRRIAKPVVKYLDEFYDQKDQITERAKRFSPAKRRNVRVLVVEEDDDSTTQEDDETEDNPSVEDTAGADTHQHDDAAEPVDATFNMEGVQQALPIIARESIVIEAPPALPPVPERPVVVVHDAPMPAATPDVTTVTADQIVAPDAPPVVAEQIVASETPVTVVCTPPAEQLADPANAEAPVPAFDVLEELPYTDASFAVRVALAPKIGAKLAALSDRFLRAIVEWVNQPDALRWDDDGLDANFEKFTEDRYLEFVWKLNKISELNAQYPTL